MKKMIAIFLSVLIAAAIMCACEKEEPLTLDKTEVNMVVGDSAELSAGKATRVNWLSSDNAVVTVNGGKLSAKSAGQATITASLENGEQQTCDITVTDKLINLITLDVKSARIEEDKTIQLTASYAPADATDKRLSWESSDESVATVDSDGYVTGVYEGTATITCRSSNGVEATCSVIVEKMILPTETPTLPPATEKPTEKVEPTEAQSEEITEAPDDDDSDDSEPDDNEPEDDGAQDHEEDPSGSGFVFPESSERYLSQEEIAARLNSMTGTPVSDSFSQDAVNEIFARHGYVFRTPSIRAYYEAQPWYRPDPGYDGTLTEIESHNSLLFSEF